MHGITHSLYLQNCASSITAIIMQGLIVIASTACIHHLMQLNSDQCKPNTNSIVQQKISMLYNKYEAVSP